MPTTLLGRLLRIVSTFGLYEGCWLNVRIHLNDTTTVLLIGPYNIVVVGTTRSTSWKVVSHTDVFIIIMPFYR